MKKTNRVLKRKLRKELFMAEAKQTITDPLVLTLGALSGALHASIYDKSLVAGILYGGTLVGAQAVFNGLMKVHNWKDVVDVLDEIESE